MQQRHQAVHLQRRGLEVGHTFGLFDLQRDDVRVVGDEAHQVELAQHADDGRAVAHQHAVHAVADHQQQGLEQLAVGVDADQVEACHVAHRDRLRWQVAAAAVGAPQQRVAQVGGGEHAEALAVAHQRVALAGVGHQRTHAHQVERAVHVEGLAHIGVAHAGHHQRQELALLVARLLPGQPTRDLGEHRGAEGRVGRQQRLQRGLGDLPGRDLVERHRRAGGARRQQRACAEQRARAIGGLGQHAGFAAHVAFDQQVGVGRLHLRRQHRVVGRKVHDARGGAHQRLLRRVQRVEGWDVEVEIGRHGLR